MKFIFKSFFLLLTLVLSFSTLIHAEENKQEKEEKNEGTVIYHVKYDYEAICNFLGMSMEEYNHNWNEGLSISEMAKKKGIERKEVEGYFYNFHYEEMQIWRKKGVMTERDYFDLVYRLADEIEEFIDRNPNR
ncbi:MULTISPECIES: hypothetical protein [unclassified Lysinibacillus]|uniref:hypothetical protein n=1 Tax=unclassified Lysinibacillus TaxID=2636778 RepID=UPI0038156CC9